MFPYVGWWTRPLNLADDRSLTDDRSCKLKDGQYLRGNSPVTPNKVMSDFNSGQFKIWMKKIAAQVYFYLSNNGLT